MTVFPEMKNPNPHKGGGPEFLCRQDRAEAWKTVSGIGWKSPSTGSLGPAPSSPCSHWGVLLTCSIHTLVVRVSSTSFCNQTGRLSPRGLPRSFICTHSPGTYCQVPPRGNPGNWPNQTPAPSLHSQDWVGRPRSREGTRPLTCVMGVIMGHPEPKLEGVGVQGMENGWSTFPGRKSHRGLFGSLELPPWPS